MCLGYFDWLDNLLYEVNLKIGDKEDILHMDKYKNIFFKHPLIIKDEKLL